MKANKARNKVYVSSVSRYYSNKAGLMVIVVNSSELKLTSEMKGICSVSKLCVSTLYSVENTVHILHHL
jgi:hypothetical protein